MIFWVAVLWIITFILSIFTVYIVYKIYLFNRLDKAWLFIALGFFIIVILRILTLLNSGGYFPSFFKFWYVYDPVIRILDSLSFIIGFWSMLKNFENFEVVEKKVKKLVKKGKK